MKTNWLLALTLTAALAPMARAQSSHAPAEEWRARVLGHEHRLHDNPDRDFDGTIGPRYIYKNGLWYTADMRWVYWEGAWVTDIVRVTRTQKMVVKRAPEG